MTEIDFKLEIAHGDSFYRLFKYLKFTETAILTFSKDYINYDEVINTPIEGSNKKLFSNIWNSCKFYTANIGSYIYNYPDPEFNICFTVKTLLDKIKTTKKKDKIRIYKTKEDERIYINVIKPTMIDEDISVSFITPLRMISPELYRTSTDDEVYPNVKVATSYFKENCTKIKPSQYKSVAVRCYNTYMDCGAVSVDGNDGHFFTCGKKPVFDSSKVYLTNFAFDFKNLNGGSQSINFHQNSSHNGSHGSSQQNSLGNLNTKKNDINVNIISKDIFMEINLSANTFKNLGGLCNLSGEYLELFFIENSYIKIKTDIGNYGIIKTCIKTESLEN